MCGQCRVALHKSTLNSFQQAGSELMSHAGGSLDRLIWYDRHLSLFGWSEVWRKFMKAWKYDGQRNLYNFFLNPLVKRMPEMLKFQFDRIVLIDSGFRTRQRRGFQPCLDLAKFLANLSGVPCGMDLHKNNSRGQSGRGYRERFWQMHTGLRLNFQSVATGHWLLLEDVFTTGATANEAARQLKKCGVTEVSVLSLIYREEEAMDVDSSLAMESGQAA